MKTYIRVKNSKDVICIKEGFLQSIFVDIVTFSVVCAAMYFNYKLCGNSKIMSGAFLICLVSSGLSFGEKVTIDEAISILESKRGLEK